jgi:co-chaperonin GroES (HSP10)
MLVRTKTAGGIHLPSGATDPQTYVRVTSVGEEVKNIKEGDIIVCHARGGMDAVFEKEITKVLKYDEIYGILTDERTIELLKEVALTGASEGENRIKPATSLIV